MMQFLVSALKRQCLLTRRHCMQHRVQRHNLQSAHAFTVPYVIGTRHTNYLSTLEMANSVTDWHAEFELICYFDCRKKLELDCCIDGRQNRNWIASSISGEIGSLQWWQANTEVDRCIDGRRNRIAASMAGKVGFNGTRPHSSRYKLFWKHAAF